MAKIDDFSKIDDLKVLERVIALLQEGKGEQIIEALQFVQDQERRAAFYADPANGEKLPGFLIEALGPHRNVIVVSGSEVDKYPSPMAFLKDRMGGLRKGSAGEDKKAGHPTLRQMYKDLNPNAGDAEEKPAEEAAAEGSKEDE